MRRPVPCACPALLAIALAVVAGCRATTTAATRPAATRPAATTRTVAGGELDRATSTLARDASTAAPSRTGWKLRSRHFVYGMPVPTDGRHAITSGPGATEPGISVLVREGFVVGHYDRLKVPAWVSMRWTRQDYEASEQLPRQDRPFRDDQELPTYARAGTSYNFAQSRMERGHMARHEDNKAWGQDNSDAGCLMSNIVPQHEDMNGEAWNDLEDLHRSVVANPAQRIGAVWVISGPVFEGNEPASRVGNGVGVPQATYKVLGWFDARNRFNVRGYVVRQADRVRDPAHYLKTVDEIEAAVGLDFFPELDDAVEAGLEAERHATLWD